MLLTNLLSELHWISVLLAIIIGTGISVLIHLTGVGGGVLVIPVLSIAFSLPPVMVVGTASMYVTFSKLFSSISHIKSGTVDWRSTLWFLLGAVPAVLLTTIAIVVTLDTFPEYNSLLQQCVYYATIAFILLACLVMIKSTKPAKNRSCKPGWLAISGALTGVVMGTTGIGGGVLIIPALTMLTALKIKQVISGSLVIALAISLLTGLVYSQGGQIHISVLVGLLIGSIIGVYTSNLFRHRIPDRFLHYGIIVIIIVSALIMLLRGAPV